MEVHYLIVEAESLSMLEAMVNSKMYEGWKPQGGIAVSIENGIATYYQAITIQETS